MPPQNDPRFLYDAYGLKAFVPNFFQALWDHYYLRVLEADRGGQLSSYGDGIRGSTIKLYIQLHPLSHIPGEAHVGALLSLLGPTRTIGHQVSISWDVRLAHLNALLSLQCIVETIGPPSEHILRPR